MANRLFLKPLSFVLAALASASAGATAKPSQAIPMKPVSPEAGGPTTADSTVNTQGSERVISYRQGDDLFSFVLARNDVGDITFQHQSHSSHGSHGSHSSHSSHFS